VCIRLCVRVCVRVWTCEYVVFHIALLSSKLPFYGYLISKHDVLSTIVNVDINVVVVSTLAEVIIILEVIALSIGYFKVPIIVIVSQVVVANKHHHIFRYTIYGTVLQLLYILTYDSSESHLLCCHFENGRNWQQQTSILTFYLTYLITKYGQII